MSLNLSWWAHWPSTPPPPVLFLYPVKVTLHLRIDRGEFWAESFETFDVPIGTPLPVAWRLNAAASDEDAVRLLELYDPEVKRTHFQLRQLFRP